jgi:hypothetical protein
MAGVAWHSRGLLGFIRKRRGAGFALGSLAAIVLHYTICGLGFALAHVTSPYPRERAAAPKYRYVEHQTGVAKPSAVALERF